MPAIPSYWLPRPALKLDDATRASFEALYASAVAPGTGAAIDYTLAAPRWQFLAYLADHHPLVLHGSGRPDIDEFEPRQPHDTLEFSNQLAVYAAPDGLWPMYFAILDRERYPMSLINGCVRLSQAGGPVSEPYYFFSISQPALAQTPWRTGTVYLLPAASFTRQPPLQLGLLTVHVAQAASLAPVRPLARLAVRPNDFPFLQRIRGHDDATVAARSAADPDGFPWVAADEV